LFSQNFFPAHCHGIVSECSEERAGYKSEPEEQVHQTLTSVGVPAAQYRDPRAENPPKVVRPCLHFIVEVTATTLSARTDVLG
jgi:hypothetical protein